MMALIDRGDYWQCAYVFANGDADGVRARGLDRFRAEVAGMIPGPAPDVAAITSWADVKVLTVALDRLERWHMPGLLAIGDAAHAMSPIAGLGINVAIQDAVAAANILAGPMARGEDVDRLLARVQARRAPAVRFTQGFQDIAQRRIVCRVLSKDSRPVRPARLLRVLNRVAPLRRLPAALIGFRYTGGACPLPTDRPVS